MEPTTNNIDDFPEHWDGSLLGIEFWIDAEQHNKTTNDGIEAEENGTLHTKFPFNLGQEQNARARSISNSTAAENDEVVVEVAARRGRRFSMSDTLGFTSLTRRNSIQSASARVRDFARRARSISRTRSSSIVPNIPSRCRSNSLLRSALNVMSGKGRDESEPPEPALLPADQGTPTNPLLNFRGGETWAAIPQDRRVLGIDVFWPANDEEEGSSNKNKKLRPMLDIEELAPLSMFRNLRVLKITGMIQSYQRYIWQAAWLNVNLDELEMGMSLEPRFRRSFNSKWPYIKGGWQLPNIRYGEPVYYGGNGDGTLDRKIGVGEYLDKMVIEKAKICAMAMGRTRNRLSIRTLVLTGFVVDADPFLHWFDPKRFKCINFKDYCVDAGFYLPAPMKKVSILFPRQVCEKTVVGRRMTLPSELKVIEMKGGKMVGEMPYTGAECLKKEIPPIAGVDADADAHAEGGVVKGKENQSQNGDHGRKAKDAT